MSIKTNKHRKPKASGYQAKVEDIRLYKSELRTRYKGLRAAMNPAHKKLLDDAIFERIIATRAYKEAELILTYVSTDIEVDTKRLISHALKTGKTVAVPKCNTKNTTMDFYRIHSFDQLEEGAFSVLEPKNGLCEKQQTFDNSLCIVPALVFDMQGYRLGYGKGYYDRFLSSYSGKRIGICYCFCTVNELIHGYYDRPVDALITEKYLKSIM